MLESSSVYLFRGASFRIIPARAHAPGENNEASSTDVPRDGPAIPRESYRLQRCAARRVAGFTAMQAVHTDIARSLVPFGLAKTLLVEPLSRGFSVNRLQGGNGPLAYRALATVEVSNIEVIGRVGLPDPRLGLAWSRSMTFYGRRFDAVACADPHYGLRRKLAVQSDAMTRRQIARDDLYPVVGSYYAAFRNIIQVKRRTPFVLMSNTLSAATSFPVVLLDCTDRQLAATLATSLRLILRSNAADEGAKREGDADTGIHVVELPAEDFEKYFS